MDDVVVYPRPTAVFFDVDGVLVDSLPQHLRICVDKAVEYGLRDLSVPNVETFRTMVAAGVKVSPMIHFFRAVGFPEPLAERATREYERDFMRLYRPAAFVGALEMIARVHAAGLVVGLVTANTRGNVEPVLAPTLLHVDPRCRFYVDSVPPSASKAWCLSEGARRLGCPPAELIFVGDQPADAAAATEAGCAFLGVSYGWGVRPDESRWPVAHTVADAADRLIATAAGLAPR